MFYALKKAVSILQLCRIRKNPFSGKEGLLRFYKTLKPYNSHLKAIEMLNTVLICQQHLVVKSILKSHVEKSPPEENYIIM